MKKITLLFATIIFLASCVSIDKLVEKGNYNEAVLLSIRKLQGKKKKKTKYVKGLEEAFAKINQRDLNSAKRLIDQNRNSNWPAIYSIYNNINDRQLAIEPLLPLYSKDGYKADFTFVKIVSLLDDAALNAAAFEYNKGDRLMERAINGNKEAAREANQAFLATKYYVSNYKDSNDKALKALYYGKTRVAIDVKNNAHVILPAGFEREILNVKVHDLNTRWTEYYTHATDHPIDVRAVLEINNIDVSPEREVIRNFVDTKKIKDGFDYVLDKKGNVMKDTMGNDIKVDRFKTIKARVKEITRTKAALVAGTVAYYDVHTGERFRTEQVNVEANFIDVSCKVRGDKRALKKERRNHLKNYPDPFPSDFALTMDAAENLKSVLKKQIKRAII